VRIIGLNISPRAKKLGTMNRVLNVSGYLHDITPLPVA